VVVDWWQRASVTRLQCRIYDDVFVRWAYVPTILNVELFPQPVHSVAVAVCSFIGLTAGAACSYTYSLLSDRTDRTLDIFHVKRWTWIFLFSLVALSAQL